MSDQKSLPEPEKNADGESLIDGGKVMSLFEHLDELRGRIVRVLLVITVLFGLFLLRRTKVIQKCPLLFVSLSLE